MRADDDESKFYSETSHRIKKKGLPVHQVLQVILKKNRASEDYTHNIILIVCPQKGHHIVETLHTYGYTLNQKSKKREREEGELPMERKLIHINVAYFIST